MQLQGRELQIGMRGADVALLQFELSVLAANGMLGTFIDEGELFKSAFEGSTEQAVLEIQSQHGMDKTGVVEGRTAEVINSMIRDTNIDVMLEQVWSALKRLHSRIDELEGGSPDLRAEVEHLRATVDLLNRELDRTHAEAAASAARVAELTSLLAEAQARIQELVGLLDRTNARSLVVTGQVMRAGGQPAGGMHVKALHRESPEGGRSTPLGEANADAGGLYAIRYEPLPGVQQINLQVVVVGERGATLGASELRPAPSLVETIDLVLSDARPQAPLRRVEGRVVYQNGLAVAANAITLRLYRAGFGGEQALLAEAPTRDNGLYTLTFGADSSAANLFVFAVTDGGETQLSKPLAFPRSAERINADLVAPFAPPALPSEYTRLAADLAGLTGGMEKLRDAKEDDKIQDITVLHRATGWDARLIGLAALGERLRGTVENPLPQEAVYGMLRAGLPSDKLMLAQVHPDVVAGALKAATAAGVVQYDDAAIEEFKQQFIDFADQTRMSLPVPGSSATYAQMLDLAGLTTDQRTAFTREYLQHHGDAPRLWDAAKQAGLDDSAIGKLQLQGKLALLTRNSEPLLRHLMSKGLTDPSDLVERDLFTPAAWESELATVAADTGQQVDALIPRSYAGNPQERLHAYAADMARKLRLSYPTQVVGRLVEKDDADRFKLGPDKAAAAALLKSAAKQGFRLGQTPVTTFLRDHPGVGAEAAVAQMPAVQQHLATLQSVYQIAPGNDAMQVLLGLNIKSAYDVTAYTEAEFDLIYDKKYREYFGKPSEPEKSRIIHRKARQVSSVTYNLFAVTKKLDSEPFVPALGGSSDVRDDVVQNLIRQLPTLESLFGSMDFCECEHCRSVLSPAAYLVDLLQFVDPQDEVWQNKVDVWSMQHHGKPYPHLGSDTKPLKPYGALVERRPDLPYIPLTCENTNTVLPYIDVVNEILEYYVAHDRLAEDAAHDTGDADSADLLAEPQNVIRDAYDKVGSARYPLILPFDPWIETARQFCDYYETPLAELLEIFRPTDKLFDETQLYDRSTVFLEALGIGPLDRELLFDPDPLAGDKWHALYGLPVQKPVIRSADNSINATLDVDNAAAANFREGMVCGYYDSSAGSLHDESMAIRSIELPDSAGAGRTRFTFKGVWTTPPEADDLLVCLGEKVLASAKTLARRLNVTYKEVVEIVQGGFVNPRLTELAILYKLGVSIHDAEFYRAHKDLLARDPATLSEEEKEWLPDVAAFDLKLDQLAATYNTPRSQLAAAIDNIPYDAVLVLADPDTGCNFDATTLQYADGSAVDPAALLRINLFVRLWRKLGWTIEETDRALLAFVPRNAPLAAAHLGQRPLLTALIYLSHLDALDKRLPLGKQSRLKWSTLWLPIPATGKNPLYARLFLNRSVLKSGEVDVVIGDETRRFSVFDDPLGRYLEPEVLAALAAQVRFEVSEAGVDDAHKLNPAAFGGDNRVSVRYDSLGQVQHLAYVGVLTDGDKALLAALVDSELLDRLLDAVQTAGKEFPLLKSHQLALQGALNLSADDIRLILDDSGLALHSADIDSTHPQRARLSLEHVSLLYRYGLLAKALKLPVREMIRLKQLSGLDPFAALSADPLPVAADAAPSALELDRPYTQTLGFVEIVEQVKTSGLNGETLDYLFRHRFDQEGTFRQDRSSVQALLKGLVDGVRAIRAEHAVPEDPGAFSDELLRQKLGLVLPAAVADTFMAMLNGAIEYTAVAPAVEPLEALDFAALSGEPAIRAVTYNATRKEQRLAFRGVLLEAARQKLESELPTPAEGSPHVPSPLLSVLLRSVQNQAQEFFDTHLLGSRLSEGTTAGFLDAADFALLFTPLPAIPADLPAVEQLAKKKENDAALRARRRRLAESFLPFLQRRLIRRHLVQTMTSITGAEPVLLESLLADKRLLARSGSALADILAAAAADGVSENLFEVDALPLEITPTAAVAADPVLANTDGRVKSAQFRGYLEAPAAGAYRFYVRLAESGAIATLTFDHLPHTPFWQHTATDAKKEFGDGAEEYLELKPGVLYGFRLDLANLAGGRAEMHVQGETLAKGSLARLRLYAADRLHAAEEALLLLNKALLYVQSLGLSEREVRYLLTHAPQFDSFNLSELPVPLDGTAAPASAAVDHFRRFLRVAAYTGLKNDLAGGSDELIALFEANASPEPDKLQNRVYPLIARLTRRSENVVAACARALSASQGFPDERSLQRLWKALEVVESFGAPLAALLTWRELAADIVPGDLSAPGRRFALARDLKEIVKARYEPEVWQRVAQPIFDKLRRRQRDALAAYVMHQRGFARLEQLYEYFLIDPGMEPVVQTSRIRLAIASVQLFIQRCLLNLEPRVSPSMINARQWEWMKRYRVWEANRKIFLFPENWLEPEFRDDKTHLFGELEGALLQGDVSRDLVEDAFFNYLKKLDELARLDIVGMHIENTLDMGSRVVHVIGRTYAQPHKYFYRRYTTGGWTPWEPVSAEIQGDHLAPVIWRDRLYLFWVTFLEKVDPTATTVQNPPPEGLAQLTMSKLFGALKGIGVQKKFDVQLHWSEYLHGQWTTPESGPLLTATQSAGTFDPRAVFVHVEKRYTEDGDELGVNVHLGGAIKQSFYLAGRNSVPVWDVYQAQPDNRYGAKDLLANRYSGSGTLTVTYTQRITSDATKEPLVDTPKILNKTGAYTLLPPNNYVPPPGVPTQVTVGAADSATLKNRLALSRQELAALVKPFFYQDDSHTLFVQPSVEEQTLEEVQDWIIKTPQDPPTKVDPGVYRPPHLVPFEPWRKVHNGGDPPWEWKYGAPSLVNPAPDHDWLVNPATGIVYDERVVGQTGWTGLQTAPATKISDAATIVAINAASSVAADNAVFVNDLAAAAASGVQVPGGGLNVIGAGGLNSGLAENYTSAAGAGFGKALLNVGNAVVGLDGAAGAIGGMIEMGF